MTVIILSQKTYLPQPLGVIFFLHKNKSELPK